MKLLPLYNQLLESKRTEAGADKIIQRYYIAYLKDYDSMAGGMYKNENFRILEDPNTIIGQLKSADTSEGQKNLEAMAYLLCQQLSPRANVGEITMENMRSTFEDYNDLLGRGKIKPIQLSKKGGLKIGDEQFNSFLPFQEYIHGQKNLFGQKDKRSGELVVNIDDKPVFNKNGIEIYDAFDVGRCIKYGYTSQIDKGMKPYSFCISNPKITNNMWQSYRDSKGSTFYFIFDKNRDAEDPLHIVVFDNTSTSGVELTDANNTTGRVAEYGTDVNEYINYLESKGVSARELMPNREYSSSEKEESNLLRKRKEDLDWFKKLPLDYKEKYIGRGHKLTVDQFMYISPNGDLVSKYIQLGHILDSKEQFGVLSSNQRKTYLRARMNMITHYFNDDDDYDRRNGLNIYRFKSYELAAIPEKIRMEYILKLAGFIALWDYEFEFVPDDMQLAVKNKSYLRDARADTIKNIVQDVDFPMDERENVIEVYLDTRISRGENVMVANEIFYHFPNEIQDHIMKRIIENNMQFSDDWERMIPKRFFKSYIELMGSGGKGFPQYDLISQPLIDLFIKLMGDNNKWMNTHSLKEGSQEAIDYYLMKGLEQGHPTNDGIFISGDMFSLGSDRAKSFYHKKYDARLHEKMRGNVKKGSSAYNKIDIEDIEFASPTFRENWYIGQLDDYYNKFINLGASNFDKEDEDIHKEVFVNAAERIIDGLLKYGNTIMPDTSEDFRREAFGKFIEMGKLNWGSLIKDEYNNIGFRHFVEMYCPKDLIPRFVEMVPSDAKWNTWAKSSYLEDNNV